MATHPLGEPSIWPSHVYERKIKKLTDNKHRQGCPDARYGLIIKNLTSGNLEVRCDGCMVIFASMPIAEIQRNPEAIWTFCTRNSIRPGDAHTVMSSSGVHVKEIENA